MVCAAATVLVMSPRPHIAAQSSTWAGTWILNLAKSAYKPERPPIKRASRRIAQAGAQLTIIDEIVGSRGGVVHLEWTGAFDGMEYPVEGLDTPVTNAYRLLDERNCELVQRIDGHIVATARLSISSDGWTMTTVTTSPSGSSTTVHDRQPNDPP
jgi:hypothetical protein